MNALWTRAYATLLLLYPRDVRRRDGKEMIGLFSDLVSNARKSGGPVAAALVAIRICLGTP